MPAVPRPTAPSTTLLLGGAVPRADWDAHDSALVTLFRLRDRDSRIVLTDRAEHLAAAPELTALADEVHALDHGDVTGCVAWSWAQGPRFDAVLGFREDAAESAAAVAEALGLPGNPLTAVRRVRMRDRCRDYLRRHGFRQPRLLLCTRPEQAEELLLASGRVVVRPRDGAGPGRVSLVTEADRLPDAFRAAGADERAPVLVESWVGGVGYRVDGVLLAGRPRVLAVTRQPAAPEPAAAAPVPRPRTPPAASAAPARDPEAAVRAEVCAALQVLGLRTGPFQVECRTGPAGVVVGGVHVGPGEAAGPAGCHPGCELYGTWLDDLLTSGPPPTVPSRAPTEPGPLAGQGGGPVPGTADTGRTGTRDADVQANGPSGAAR
ncbi:hypothetical protein [Streptomyces sp. HNM0574]|uniref:hypothetical protein n=1 Tax=Streptomyces sp. HNM0574 TaxID=2714954 RepID=UPI00146AD537|nr:hypothetical protein [Streptomyces sp. HNM0574]NLU67787.1 hypothetical protein [Streptomyces sp. HNM0574]